MKRVVPVIAKPLVAMTKGCNLVQENLEFRSVRTVAKGSVTRDSPEITTRGEVQESLVIN